MWYRIGNIVSLTWGGGVFLIQIIRQANNSSHCTELRFSLSSQDPAIRRAYGSGDLSRTSHSKRTEFNPRAVNVGFTMEKVAIGQVSLPEIQFPAIKYHFTSLIYHMGLLQCGRQEYK